MECNVSNTDRIARVVLALVIFAVALVTTPWLAVVSLILLATVFMKWCPIYRMLGISTCPPSAS